MGLHKFGSINRIAVSALAEKVEADVDKVIEAKKENFVYLRSRSISAGDCGPKGTKWNYNGNYDYFSKAQLLQSYQTFCGRNLFLNHDTSSPLKAVGRVLDAYPVTDPDTGEFYIETLARIDKQLHPELANMVLNGDLNSVSMGASCGASTCSICAHTIHSDQDNKCNHMARLGMEFEAEADLSEYGIKKGDRVPAFCINSDLTFSELSIVSVPADSAALIKTVIAAFQGKLTKTASRAADEAKSIAAEFEMLLGLLPKEAQLEIKRQICEEVGSCKMAQPEKQPQKEASIYVEAAAYDVLVHALALADEHALASLDLFEAMKEAGFTTGRTKDGKPERQVFYTALHSAINNGWVQQVEPGVYSLTDSGVERANHLKEFLGEDVWPGHGRLGPKKTKEPKPKEEPTKTPESVPMQAPVPEPEKKEPIWPTDAQKLEKLPAEPAKEELAGVEASHIKQPHTKAPHTKNIPDQLEMIKSDEEKDVMDKPTPQEMSKAMAGQKNSEIDSILGKLSGLEYERLQEHMAHKIKARDNFMDNTKAEVKPQVAKAAEEAMPPKEMEEMPPKAQEEAQDVQKLEQAEKLIKEVKEHEKQEMKEEMTQSAKDTPMEAPEAMAAQKPILTAKFTRKPFLSKSFWTIYAGEHPVLTASLAEICGEHLPAMRSLVTTSEYGDRLIARISSDGFEKVAALLNVKADMEHLRGKEWDTKAHEKGYSEVRKMQESEESQADKSKKDMERPYGEPGDHLKPSAKAEAKVEKAAATDKKAADEKGFSPAMPSKENLYEKGGAEVVKALEGNERESDKSKKAIDRPYGEPGDHLKAQAAQEKGMSPDMKSHEKDYEKGFEEVKKAQEAEQKEVNKDKPEHMRVTTSYEAGEHLVATKETPMAKKAGACPCGKPECKCECMLGKECSCTMAAMPKEAGKLEPMHGESPDTLTKADKAAGDVRPEGPTAGGAQNWDKNKDMFKSDKVPSDEAKKAEVGKEAKLEKGEQTLSDAEKEKANPAGGAREDLMQPVAETAAEQAIGTADKAADISKGAKLEPGEQSLADAEKMSTGTDELKTKKGPEAPSDEAKAKEIGREAALAQEITEARARIQKLEADLADKAMALGQEKLERALEAKMIKCRKLVEEMVKKDILAEDQTLVDKYVKSGENLLDARKSALKENIDRQLGAFMQMPDSLLQVQAETIARMKKTATHTDKLSIPPFARMDTNGVDELAWMNDLPWK